MRLGVELGVALDLSLEVTEGVEIMQAHELLADALHYLVVALSVCGHIFIQLIMATHQSTHGCDYSLYLHT